jgi:hypothetical protein
MTRRLLIGLALLLAAAQPLRADLKYSTHSELKPATVADPEPPNPILAMLGPQIMQQMLPSGSADTVYIVTDKGMRTEFVKGGMNQLTEGSVLLVMANGDVVQLNTKDKTYWKATLQAFSDMVQRVGIQPEVTLNPTSESATIQGIRSARSNFQISIPLPIPDQMRSQMPPGFPAAFTMTGEIWYATSPFERYVAMNSRLGLAMGGGVGLAKLLQGGIVMRQVLRSSLFGGRQLESEVTKIGEEPAPADAFDIPADYKEVASPVR